MKIILCGCLGRMGTAVTDLVAETFETEIVLGTDRRQPKQPRTYPVQEHLTDYAADVLICYVPPIATISTDIIDYCVAKKMPAVICTTAVSKNFSDAMEEAAKTIPIFYSANMSFGVTVFNKMLEDYSALLYKAGFDIELVEKHHNKKMDAPSGTAVKLLETIHKATPELNIVSDRTNQKAERTRKEIGVHTIRGGSIVGEHSVIFAGKQETIEISHSAISREVFAEGTLRAARFVIDKPPGIYEMKDLIV